MWRFACWQQTISRTFGRSDFRKRHLAALAGLFEQVLRLARELGAPRLDRVAIDGSKVQANASKHKAMSYDRMREKTRQLRDEVQDLLAQAEAADAAEDAEYGADQRGDELPAELQRRESRLARIREARRALEARAKAEAEAAAADASTDTATSFDLLCAGNSGQGATASLASTATSAL